MPMVHRGREDAMSANDQELQSARRIPSPEHLNDYLKVTNPKIWALLIAIILFIGGFWLWSTVTTIESYATGTAQAVGGELVITFDDDKKASRVQPGMEMTVGDVRTEILAVGTDDKGHVVASAQAHVPDGSYLVRVGYKTSQVIDMLLNT